MSESTERLTLRPTRRAVVKGVAALAGLAAAGTPGVTVFAAGARSSRGHDGPRANVLLAHGVWADGSSWGQVIPILQERGHTVVSLQMNLQSLASDVAWAQHVLTERVPPGPTVLAGHSYGGAVISGAGTGAPAGRVIGLVFASAFAPDAGETLGGLGAMFPAAPALSHLQPDSQGFLWFDPTAFAASLAQDLPLPQADVAAAAQRPGAAELFTDVVGTPAWRTVPSWTLISTQDRAIDPDLQRFMARRANARTIEVASSHLSILSHPQQVAGLILAAAEDGRR